MRFYKIIAGLTLAFVVLGIFPSTLFLSNLCKYAVVIVCFATSLTATSPDKRYVQVGLGLTLITDFLLLFTQANVSGMLLFSIVHMCYLSRWFAHWHYLLLSVPVAFFFLHWNLYYGAALFYACFLLLDVLAAQRFAPNYLKLGMLSFAACDACIALVHLFHLGLTSIPQQLIWLFYVPALLALVKSIDPSGLASHTNG